MKKTNKFVMTAALTLAAGLCFCAAKPLMAQQMEEERIVNGVYIGKVDVSGLTRQEAESAIDTYVDSMMDTTFTFVGASGSMTATAAEMGLTADAADSVEQAMTIAHTGNLINRFKETKDLESSNITLDLGIAIDKQATAMLIYEQKDNLNIQAKDNGLIRENGEFVFVKGQTGNEVDIVSSVNRISEYLSQEWDGTNNLINLVTEEIEPRGSESELAQVKDLLGTFSTSYTTSAAGRATNVSNGCSKINGTVLFPGEEFSVYDAISPFTLENGYAEGGSYENGTVVQTIGGGICQVSTTLYNAVIRAELEISLRYNHSMIIAYAEPSADAAIASGIKDFRFVNSNDTPVYIEGICADRVITFNIYGVETRPENRKVTFESETLEVTEPKVEYTLSDAFDAGYYNVDQSEHKGIKARLWKVVTVDGVEQSREIFNTSTYKSSPKYVTIGTKGIDKKALKAIKSAIKSEDEAAVKAAVSASAKSKDDDKDKDDDEEAEIEETEDTSEETTEDVTVTEETPAEVVPEPTPEPTQEPTVEPTPDATTDGEITG